MGIVLLVVLFIFQNSFRQGTGSNIFEQETVVMDHRVNQMLDNLAQIVDNEIDASLHWLKKVINYYKNISKSVSRRKFLYYINMGTRWNTLNHFDDLDYQIRLIKSLLFNITKEFKQTSVDVEDEQNISLNNLNTILSNMIRNINFCADNLIP